MWFFKPKLKYGTGAFRDRPDSRDRLLKAVIGEVKVDWEKGYNVESDLGIQLKVENQDGSSSCVGQAWAKYTEAIDCAETGKLPDHSAKSIYEQIYVPGGGAYLREGAKVIVKGGVALEELIPSYENGNPPSEPYMTSQTISNDVRECMKVYRAKEYRFVSSSDVDLLAWTIANNHGAVSGADGDSAGWQTGEIKNPKKREWGHAFYFTGFGLVPGRGRYLDFINSWSEQWGFNGKGRFYLDEYDIAQWTYGAWTLIDLPNFMQTNVKIIKDKNSTACGIWLPATCPAALESYCANFGLEVPKTPNGDIDWNAWISGELELKK